MDGRAKRAAFLWTGRGIQEIRGLVSTDYVWCRRCEYRAHRQTRKRLKVGKPAVLSERRDAILCLDCEAEVERKHWEVNSDIGGQNDDC